MTESWSDARYPTATVVGSIPRGRTGLDGASASVLLVEDDGRLVTALTRTLEAVGYSVSSSTSVADALASFEHVDPDVVVLDWGLPDGDGLSLCRELRRRAFGRPILLMTARADVSDKVRAFRDGCDDFLVKPVVTSELVARIAAHLRNAARGRLFSGDIEVRFPELEVLVGRRRLEHKLTPLELKLLVEFLRQPGRVLSRQHLLAAVFDAPSDRASNVVAVHLGHLRSKLGEAGKRLETVKGGYRLQPT
jgi:DNA-binding response OmpR family regulator